VASQPLRLEALHGLDTVCTYCRMLFSRLSWTIGLDCPLSLSGSSNKSRPNTVALQQRCLLCSLRGWRRRRLGRRERCANERISLSFPNCGSTVEYEVYLYTLMLFQVPACLCQPTCGRALLEQARKEVPYFMKLLSKGVGG